MVVINNAWEVDAQNDFGNPLLHPPGSGSLEPNSPWYQDSIETVMPSRLSEVRFNTVSRDVSDAASHLPANNFKS